MTASVKLTCSRLAREVATDALQVLGAYGASYGASTEHCIEPVYRQAKVYGLVQALGVQAHHHRETALQEG